MPSLPQIPLRGRGLGGVGREHCPSEDDHRGLDLQIARAVSRQLKDELAVLFQAHEDSLLSRLEQTLQESSPAILGNLMGLQDGRGLQSMPRARGFSSESESIMIRQTSPAESGRSTTSSYERKTHPAKAVGIEYVDKTEDEQGESPKQRHSKWASWGAKVFSGPSAGSSDEPQATKAPPGMKCLEDIFADELFHGQNIIDFPPSPPTPKTPNDSFKPWNAVKPRSPKKRMKTHPFKVAESSTAQEHTALGDGLGAFKMGPEAPTEPRQLSANPTLIGGLNQEKIVAKADESTSASSEASVALEASMPERLSERQRRLQGLRPTPLITEPGRMVSPDKREESSKQGQSTRTGDEDANSDSKCDGFRTSRQTATAFLRGQRRHSAPTHLQGPMDNSETSPLPTGNGAQNSRRLLIPELRMHSNPLASPVPQGAQFTDLLPTARAAELTPSGLLTPPAGRSPAQAPSRGKARSSTEPPRQRSPRSHSTEDLGAPSIITTTSGRSPCTAAIRMPKTFSMVSRMSSAVGFSKSAVDELQMLRTARESDLILEISKGEDSNSASDEGSPSVNSQRSDSFMTRSSRSENDERHIASPLLLRIFGILPWTGSRWVGTAIRLSVLGAAGISVLIGAEGLAAAHTRATQDRLCNSACLQWQETSDVLLELGSLVGLLVMGSVSSQNLLGSSNAVLPGYARRCGLISAWSQASRRQGTLLVLAWALSVAVRALAPMPTDEESRIEGLDLAVSIRLRSALSIAAFSFASALFLMISFCLMHAVDILTMMVDAFCFSFVKRPCLETSVREWNILQAVLRRTSGAVSRGFLALQTTTLVAVLLGVAAIVLDMNAAAFWQVLSLSPLLVADALLFFSATEVTEKCTRVPSLVNSLSFGLDVDPQRHYLVQYVTYSAAGFYVQEVRLTAAMALKLTYISGIGAFAVLTKVTSGL
mmetsp:Transcript_31426/g.70751  ORF Transcript_31426/g.70751 Transcript_31426/m.70751 type:complete len:939 (-) Transcript_31426:98-2914(-)